MASGNNGVAVVVTYNRLNLLKENIRAILDQTIDCDLIIVNNNSNDGTCEYLDSIDNNKIKVLHLDKNVGGAGGFAYGLKQAIASGYRYSWLMDDDSIPNRDAYESIFMKAESLLGEFSFIASLVYWTDGKLFPMNVPPVDMGKKDENIKQITHLVTNKLLPIERCSFVGCFINNEIAKKTYLPISEFFIYGDDFEYTSRLSKIKKSFLDYESVIIHKAPNNQGARVAYAPIDRVDRFFYQSRNAMYIAKKQGILPSVKNIFETLGRVVRIVLVSKDGKMKRIAVVLKGMFAGIVFNPKLTMP